MSTCKNSNERFNRYKKILLEIIHEILPNCNVYLFGSRARCDHDQGSDIDLALDCQKPIELNKISQIKEKIEESIIPLFVDLVDIHTAGDTIKKEIKDEGILWEK